MLLLSMHGLPMSWVIEYIQDEPYRVGKALRFGVYIWEEDGKWMGSYTDQSGVDYWKLPMEKGTFEQNVHALFPGKHLEPNSCPVPLKYCGGCDRASCYLDGYLCPSCQESQYG